jgi:hypothetical protein
VDDVRDPAQPAQGFYPVKQVFLQELMDLAFVLHALSARSDVLDPVAASVRNFLRQMLCDLCLRNRRPLCPWRLYAAHIFVERTVAKQSEAVICELRVSPSFVDPRFPAFVVFC